MISLHMATFLINTIAFLFAYIVITTLSGAFRAWAAYKAGDSTAADLGRVSLNPASHIDWFGLFAILFIQIGWGKPVPVNPFNITRPWRGLKLFFVYFSDVFLRIFLGFFGIVTMLFLFGPAHVIVALSMLRFTHQISHTFLAYTLPEASSSEIMVMYLLTMFVYVSIILAALYAIYNTLNLLFFLMMEDTTDALAAMEFAERAYMISLLLSLVVVYFFAHDLYRLLIFGVQKMIFIVALMAGYF